MERGPSLLPRWLRPASFLFLHVVSVVFQIPVSSIQVEYRFARMIMPITDLLDEARCYEYQRDQLSPATALTPRPCHRGPTDLRVVQGLCILG